jgi:hypothetical protein
VVKALFKGKVQALFDLFRRGQAISFFRLLLLPIIIWVEVNAAELDNDLVESCRALRCVANACAYELINHSFDFHLITQAHTQNYVEDVSVWVFAQFSFETCLGKAASHSPYF